MGGKTFIHWFVQPDQGRADNRECVLKIKPKSPRVPHPMEKPTLSDKMAKARFSRNDRVIPKGRKAQPVMKQAYDAYTRLNGKPSARAKKK